MNSSNKNAGIIPAAESAAATKRAAATKQAAAESATAESVAAESADAPAAAAAESTTATKQVAAPVADRNINRIWELDFARGIAIVIMLFGHLMYDLAEIADLPVVYDRGLIYLIGRVGAFLFISVAGASCVLSRSNFRRGFKLLLISLALSAVTIAMGSEYAIKFGILHFFSICMMLYSIISRIKLKLPVWLLIISGLASIFLGFFFKNIYDTTGFLFPLGIMTPGFTSADYYPIFPYAGIFIFGVAFGKHYYNETKKSIFSFSLKPNLISKAGRHSLLIYLLHQPLLIGAILLAMQIL